MYNLRFREPEMEEFFVAGEGATDGVLQEILGWCQGTPLILNVISKCWCITSIQNVPNSIWYLTVYLCGKDTYHNNVYRPLLCFSCEKWYLLIRNLAKWFNWYRKFNLYTIEHKLTSSKFLYTDFGILLSRLSRKNCFLKGGSRRLW